MSNWMADNDGIIHVVDGDLPSSMARCGLGSVQDMNLLKTEMRPDCPRCLESVPGPSWPTDPVHQAMLRHARNAGAAVTALEIIRREAKDALATADNPVSSHHLGALQFIEKFADDVLSQVLPA